MTQLDSDDVENIKEGTYVYWMDESDDIPRGSLGEVTGVDGEERSVKFAENFSISVSATKLNVSDFQKDSFVHSTRGGSECSDDLIGEVKDLVDGKLVINFYGETVETKSEKAKYLIKSQFQPGMFVFWRKANDDIPSGHVGELLDSIHEGKMKVKFPNGCWRFRLRDLVRCNVQPGSYVQWTKSDEDVEEGEIGKVTGKISDKGRVYVAFAKDAWSFEPDTLILHELQLGAFVKWQKVDEDVKKGDMGQVVGIKVKESLLRVQFPAGRWKFKPSELSLCRIQPGILVRWTRSDADIPRGDLGEVIRLDEENKISIQWPQGHWSLRRDEIDKFKFQKGDRVQWTKSDDDIPKGHIGVVMGIRYEEDDNGKVSGKRLYVNWPNGRWSMKPIGLEALNFDTDGANQLKLSFKRFDKNGDGKLSEEEFATVLGSLGGEGGGLAPEECKQLFDALDRDEDGKLTVSEFIDYVFSDASGAAKTLLADGFGLDAALGFNEEEETDEEDDEDPGCTMKGQPFEGPIPMKSSFNPNSTEGIDENTEVSRAEWATAMLQVGVPRKASLTCFDEVLKELDQSGSEVLKLQDLAGELNGLGGAAGVEELRAPVAQVKNGEVEIIDLNVPSEEVEFERKLAMRTGIDGLVWDLMYHDKSLKAAAKFFPHAMLSELERKVLGEMSEEELVKAVQKGWEVSHTLSAVASWQRARENCQREVQEIIDRCRAEGTKYTDDSFNPLENEKEVLYVDKEGPGYNKKPGKVLPPPKCGWQRATEIFRNPQMFTKGARFSDIHQGHIGDCYMLAAVAAIAANRKSFLRQAFVAYDLEVGVYGVMFCEEMHFRYEIVDDLLGLAYKPCGHGGSLQYARSTDRNEIWVSMLEKAYFKYMGCLEMCWGGYEGDAVFAFLGGVWGDYDVNGKPYTVWETLNRGHQNGEIMCAGFKKPSKGKYSDLEGGKDGLCGEKGSELGLVFGHAYSVLQTGKAENHKLINFRNPWAHREWKGPWSDDSKEWTDEAKEKFDLKVKDDGAFWMENIDHVLLGDDIRFNRTFGPTWQCAAQYGSFGKDPPFKAIAKHSYKARDKNEISFKRGEKFEISKDVNSTKWMTGKHLRSGKEGFFRAKDVELRCEDTFKYTLTLDHVSPDAHVIISLFRQETARMRLFTVRKVDGKHEKDKYYPTAYLLIVDKHNKSKRVKARYWNRHAWETVKAKDGPFKIYVSCKATFHRRFALYAFAPHGELHWNAPPISREAFMSEVGERNNVNNTRDRVYNNTNESVGNYISLGEELMHDFPMVGGAIMSAAGTIKDIMNGDASEIAAGKVKDFVNSDQVQQVSSKVKEIINSDEAQDLMEHVGDMMNEAASWVPFSVSWE